MGKLDGVVFFLFVASACGGSGSSGLHGNCNASSDCAGGLACVPLKGACTANAPTLGYECNKTCTGDTGCTGLTSANGGAATCTGGCPGAMQCF